MLRLSLHKNEEVSNIYKFFNCKKMIQVVKVNQIYTLETGNVFG